MFNSHLCCSPTPKDRRGVRRRPRAMAPGAGAVTPATLIAFAVLLGLPSFAAANGPCGSPLDFSGTYSQRCAGNPSLVVHAALDVRGKKDKVEHRFRLYCDRADAGFQGDLERFRQAVLKVCRSLGGGDCGKVAGDLAAGIAALNDQILAALPHKIEVNVWWDQLFLFPRHHHRTQITDFFRNGGSRLNEYYLNNTCEKRGEIGAIGFAIPLLGADRHGLCFATLAAVAEGRIDPRSFAVRREVKVDGSLTCLGNGVAVNAGVTFEGTLTGERH